MASQPLARRLAGFFAVLACTATLAFAQEDEQGLILPVPTLAELESLGAIIGEIRIDNENIFDLSDNREDKSLFRLANFLHARTKPQIIRAQLLFSSGERLSVRVIDETERLLRANSYLYDVSIRPFAWHDGVVDIVVRTRDTWSLTPTASLSRSGGVNSGGVGFKDDNLLGSGMRFSVNARAASSGAGTSPANSELQLLYPNAFASRTAVAYTLSTFDGGNSRAFSVARPFYSLETRWAAGFTTSKDDRLVSSYDNGNLVAQYRRREEKTELSGGWSQGLVDGWTHRFSLGLAYQDDAYSVDLANAPAPPQLPADRTLLGPFVRYEAVEDDFRKATNVDQIGRTEYIAMGFHSLVQFGRALVALGSTEYASLYSGNLSKGFQLPSGDILLTGASFSGEVAGGHSDRQLLNASARYYMRQTKDSIFFASVAGDHARFSDGTQVFSIGGDAGLRGYPSSLQTGDRRMIVTAEERFYTNWFPFRLFRVGGALFYDAGRVWSGAYQSSASARWLSDAGFGLRLLNARSSSGTTLHLDFAFPLNRELGIRSYQFSFMSKTGF